MNSNVFSPLLQLDLKEEPEKHKFKESLSQAPSRCSVVFIMRGQHLYVRNPL